MVSVDSSNCLLLSLLFIIVACLHPGHGRVLIHPPTGISPTLNTDIRNGSDGHNLLRRDSLVDVKSSSTLHEDLDNIFPLILSRRLHRRVGKQPPAATETKLASSSAKGCSMLYMLAANADDALSRLKTNPKLTSLTSSQSKWDNAGALKQYGWTETKDSVNWAYMGVNDAMKDLGIDTASKDNVNVQLVQDTEVEVDGKKYAASKGTYDQAINVAAGLIIPYYIYSPIHEAETKKIKGEVVPFAQYSDVLFLEYSKLCGRAKANVSSLKHILFLNVENPNTWSIALKALMDKNDGKRDIPLWPGTEFSMSEAGGKALLGTQIGGPVAWMLIQHKKAFGAKSAVKVRVFRNKGMTNQDTDQPYPSLLFYIGDAPKDNHCEPADTCCCPKV